MKYLQFGIILLFIIISLAAVWRYLRRLRRDFVERIFEKRLFLKQNRSSEISFYFSPAVRKIAVWLAGQKKALLETAVTEIQKENFAFIVKALRKNGQNTLAAELSAMSGLLRISAVSPEAAVWFLLQQGNLSKAEKLLAKIKGKSILACALQNYCAGRQSLWEGDLQAASNAFSAAAAGFKKEGCAFEEAMCYLMNGTVYRVCGLSDVSRLMLMTARQIFQALEACKYEAEAVGNMGMLSAAGKSYDEAEAFFAEAASIYKKINHEQGMADIVNQQALTRLIGKQPEEASILARQALKMHRRLKNQAGEGFSLELAAHASAALKDWENTLKYSARAAKIYMQTQNIPAGQEALFLSARARFEKGEYEDSEKIVRDIIAGYQKNASCFHIANAYNLLGMIFYARGDLKRARGLFQQSLDCELRSERTEGAAVDYANMALIDYQRGLKEQGDKTLATALEYAGAFEQGSLYEKLKKIQVRH